MTRAKFGTKTLTVLMLSASLTACSYIEDIGQTTYSVEPIPEDVTSTIGVNGYLWLASLDTLSSFPIAQVDSAGGVVLTDWIINPDVPNERLKLSVNITDKVLRADALHVAVIRQEMHDGVWVDATVRAGTALQIEDAILTRARELKISSIEDE